MNAAFEVPSHIPPERVIDFANVPGATVDPHLAWKKLHHGPDIVWTPHYGGHWIATRAEDIELIQKDHEHFSHREFTLPKMPKDHKPFPLAPLELDRCPGSLLARTEIRVFIEEWLKRIPDFEIKPGEKPLTATGPVNGVVSLPLAWKVLQDSGG